MVGFLLEVGLCRNGNVLSVSAMQTATITTAKNRNWSLGPAPARLPPRDGEFVYYDDLFFLTPS